MKKKLFVLLMVFSNLYFFPQQKPIVEKVDVVNELIVTRVFYKGKPVKDLEKEDFEIYVNGKKKRITSCQLIRKKINSENIEFQSIRKKIAKPRFFILTFKVLNFSDQLKTGLDYLFKKILKKEDRVLIMVNNTQFEEINLKEKERVKDKLILLLKEECINARIVADKYLEEITNLTKNINTMGKTDIYDFGKSELLNYLNKYLDVFKEYKRRYLIPDIDKFYNFAKYLEEIKGEKWVLNFFQIEQFPAIKVFSRIKSSVYMGNENWQRMISRKISEIEKEFSFADSFPVKEVSKLFYKVDTTFHMMLMKNYRETFSRDFKYKSVFSDIEKTLKTLTKKTGGDAIFSNNIKESIRKISDKEDVVYLLSFTSDLDSGDNGIRRIKVKTKNKNYTVEYDQNQFADYINNYIKKRDRETSGIKIKDVTFKKGNLSFILKGFKRIKVNDGTLFGKVLVRIRIINSFNQIYFKSEKVVFLRKETGKFKISFKDRGKGKHILYLNIRDVLSNKSIGVVKNIEF